MIGRAIIWNVERLFDPLGSALSRSVGAPDGWSRELYVKKIIRVASVLRQLSPTTPPALLLLSEVENSRVVDDILLAAQWQSLKEVVVPGEQIEGHDVVIAYNPALFTEVADASSYNVHNRYSTRDLIVASLAARDGTAMTVFNCHWPSRTVDRSEAFRLGAADYCSRIVERLLKFDKAEIVDKRGYPRMPARHRLEARWNHKIVIAGDFNDNPHDISVRHLGNSTPSLSRATANPRLPSASGRAGVASYLRMRPRLFNPTWELISPTHQGPVGSYRHNGEWHWLDQLLVSAGMLKGTTPSLRPASLAVHAPNPMVENGVTIPLSGRGGTPRSFSERGGVSDHHPLVFDLDVDPVGV